MKQSVVVLCSVVAVLMLGSCTGGKQEIAVMDGQTYSIEPSGKMSVHPPGNQGTTGSQPLHHLKVKKKNEDSAATAQGCWACTDCICNSDDCACTECTSC